MPTRRRNWVTSMREDVLAVQQDLSFQARVAQGLVHAVQAAQEGGLAASGRADQSSDAVGGDLAG